MISLACPVLPGTVIKPVTKLNCNCYQDNYGFWHRENDWAIKYFSKEYIDDKYWYIHGKRHRVGGPAFYELNRTFLIWYKNDMRHRFNAPAKITNGIKEYWEYNVYLYATKK
jgi:hypothetical protein